MHLKPSTDDELTDGKPATSHHISGFLSFIKDATMATIASGFVIQADAWPHGATYWEHQAPEPLPTFFLAS